MFFFSSFFHSTPTLSFAEQGNAGCVCPRENDNFIRRAWIEQRVGKQMTVSGVDGVQ